MKLVPLVLLFAIGVYADCGCLNCNKHFHVLSQPGSRLQIIHRKTHHCNCPTALPYSVQIPVVPPEKTHWTRSYGYQIHPEKLVEVERKPHYCPYPHEYDAQLQVPEVVPERSTYLRNLFAHTDRVVIAEPPRRHLPKVCSRPTFETLGVHFLHPKFDRSVNPWGLQPDCKCKNPACINLYRQIIWAPQFVLQNVQAPHPTNQSDDHVLEHLENTFEAQNGDVETPQEDISENEIDHNELESFQHTFFENRNQVDDEVSPRKDSFQVSQNETLHVVNNQSEEVTQRESPREVEATVPLREVEVEDNDVVVENRSSNLNQTAPKRGFEISRSENILVLGDESKPKMYVKSTTSEISASPEEGKRRKRSINYKMLGLDTKSSYFPRKRNLLNFRKFSFQKNRDHSPYVMSPWDKRFPLRNLVAHRRPLGYHHYYGPHYRHRRSVRADDESSLPFYAWSGESNEIEDEPIKRSQGGEENLLPMLKMLSIPLKIVGDLQKNPFLAVIPKVMRVSNALFMQFVKTFMGDYRKTKRKRKLFKREALGDGCDCDARRYKRELPQQIPGNLLAYNQENLLLAEFLKTLARNVKKSRDYIEIGRTKRSLGSGHEYKELDTLTWEQLVKELEEVIRVTKVPHPVYSPNRSKRNSKPEEADILTEFVSAVDEPDAFLAAVKSTYKRFTRNRDQQEFLETPPKNKREVSLLHAILKLLKAERLVPKSADARPKRSTADLETQTINEKITETTTSLQKMISSNDFNEDLAIYKKLLALQVLKTEIGKLPRDQLMEKADEILKLKEEILQDIALKISDEDIGKWIKTLVHLQKLHCILKTLKKEPKDDLKEVLAKITFVPVKNPKQLLTFLRKRRTTKIHRDVELVTGLKLLLASGEADKIKKEAEFLWESSNLKKLQRDSVKEMAEKLTKKLRIRRELKILFDLQRQLEICENKQKMLMTEIEGPK